MDYSAKCLNAPEDFVLVHIGIPLAVACRKGEKAGIWLNTAAMSGVQEDKVAWTKSPGLLHASKNVAGVTRKYSSQTARDWNRARNKRYYR